MVEIILQFYYWLQDFFRGKPLGGLRSNQWGRVRRSFLEKNPSCAVCEKKSSLLKPLNVHHKILFSVDPSKELDFQNLVVLCPEHHLLFGHLMNWKFGNKTIDNNIKEWNEKIKNRS